MAPRADNSCPGAVGSVYDSRGNTTTLGPQTLAYDGADRHTQTTTADATIRYGRDVTDRITERKVAGVTIARYGHSGGGDTPDFTMDATGTVIERTLGLIGGASLTKRAGGDVWSYPNIHGDITATTDAVGESAGLLHQVRVGAGTVGSGRW